jgi:hypothetical protein
MGSKEAVVYFHVGLGKTGSTHLQKKIFPRLTGVHYIHSSKYRRSPAIINRLSKPAFLVSREFDQQFYDEVSWFARYFRSAYPIIVLRRQDKWIASQYRRFVKNGYRGSFSSFLDLDHDQGYFKIHELFFYRKINFLQDTFGHEPLVLFQEEMKNNPECFYNRILEYTRSSAAPGILSSGITHSSYSEKQLKFLRKFSSRLDMRKGNKATTPLYAVRLIGVKLLRYTVLYLGKRVPDRWVSDEPLISAKDLKRVQDYYAEDWQQCLAYQKPGVNT